MLIKNYAGYPAGNTITIIENVSEVVVHMGIYSVNSNGPRFEGPRMPVMWLESLAVDDESAPRDSSPLAPNTIRFIDFTDDCGVRTRLTVTQFAYICNDEGKTIEKVLLDM